MARKFEPLAEVVDSVHNLFWKARRHEFSPSGAPGYVCSRLTSSDSIEEMWFSEDELSPYVAPEPVIL